MNISRKKSARRGALSHRAVRNLHAVANAQKQVITCEVVRKIFKHHSIRHASFLNINSLCCYKSAFLYAMGGEGGPLAWVVRSHVDYVIHCPYPSAGANIEDLLRVPTNRGKEKLIVEQHG